MAYRVKHSVTCFNVVFLFTEVKSQLESVGVKSGDINGVRVPQLSIGSDNQFIGNTHYILL